ncbi:hypothetical protein C817_00874 [Dorea sp. 5-2]|jgi:hypothetical protein|nr:hypothetical protein C817_00874 [Dorea sp. 5-2]MCI9024152.1 hypothetical protein [Dorea sp.]
MEQREIMEQVNKMLSDNPAKIIKIRDAFDEMFEGRNIGSAQAISDREYERIRYIFRDIDVPLSWCTNKAAVYQLYKAVNQRRNRDSGSVYSPSKKSSRSKKKGLFGGFFN